MSRTAYLVCYVDTRSLQVVGAAIHSEPALSLTQVGVPEVALDVYSYTGKDFDDAQKKLRDYVASDKHFAWLKPLLPTRP